MKIGYVFSGGGARGIAHLGALQACIEMGIRPDVISGVSSGALIGALYAGGMQPKEIFEAFSKAKIFRTMRPAWSRFGFFNVQKLQALYGLYLPVKTFEALDIKLVIAATDIKDGITIYYDQGDLIKPLISTTCIPVLFAPFQWGDQFMVDGGVLNNLPVEPLIGNCDYIIGFHCNPNNSGFKLGSIKSMIERTFHLAIYSNVIERKKFCNLLIEPPELSQFNIFDFGRGKEIYQYGYNQAKKVLLENSSFFS